MTVGLSKCKPHYSFIQAIYLSVLVSDSVSVNTPLHKFPEFQTIMQHHQIGNTDTDTCVVCEYRWTLLQQIPPSQWHMDEDAV